MNLLIVSHGDIAKGFADTLKTFFGIKNVDYAYLSNEEGVDFLKKTLDEYFFKVSAEEQVIICSDILGGSANQNAVLYMLERPNTYLITGMNLPLIIQLALGGKDLSEAEIRNVVENAKESIVFVNDYNLNNMDENDE